MRSIKFVLLLISTSLLPSCGGDLPDYVKLGGLRLLALKVDNPEVNPAVAGTVQITPVVSDLGKNRNLTFSAEACVDPGVGLGASPSCAGRPDRVALSPGAITGLSASTKTGIAPVVSLTVPPTVFAGRSAADQATGIAYLVIYTLTATDPTGASTSVTSFKRIIASTKTTGLNHNPSLTDVQVAGQSLLSYLTALTFSGSAQTGVVLNPIFAPGSSETVGDKPETLTTTWFYSDGDLAFFRTLGTDPNGWTAPAQKPTGHGILFVVVTRDGRGGEDFKQIEL